MSIKVRKTKNGTKYDLYFSAGKHPDGRRKFIWVRGFSTKTEAKAREIEIKNDMNNNKYVSPSKYSLKEWLDTVLERKEQK